MIRLRRPAFGAVRCRPVANFRSGAYAVKLTIAVVAIATSAGRDGVDDGPDR